MDSRRPAGSTEISRRMDPLTETLSNALMQSQIRRSKELGESFLTGDRAFDFLTTALARARTNTAQLAQDLWVLFETGDKRRGYFVEFGAGDGVRLSNTLMLERDYSWRGILAEPNPVFHEALQRNRAVFVSTACVAARSGERKLLLQTEDPHFSATTDYANNDMHAGFRRAAPTVEVETISLCDLLRAAAAPLQIDYISLDTEGSEYDILEAFDFEQYNVRLLTVEHNHTPNEAKLDALLAGRGFERRFAEFTDFDAWYVKTGPEPAKTPRLAELWDRLCHLGMAIRNRAT